MRRFGYIAIGSNLGDRMAALQCAVNQLAAVKAIVIEALSHVVETPAWGYESEHSFLNAVIRFSTTRLDEDLDGILSQCEQACGRERSAGGSAGYADRAIDIDLIWLDGWTGENSSLEVPHPRAHERAFVLLPLEELQADIMLDGRSLADCIDALPDAEYDAVSWRRELALQWPK